MGRIRAGIMGQGESISAARAAARMSQEHLAKAAGVSVRTVIRAEGGHGVSDESIRALSAVLGMQASEMPPPAYGAMDGAAVLAAASSPSDEQGMASDIRILCGHASDTVTGIRAVLRTDMVALRREHAHRQGLVLDPADPRYMAKVGYLWCGLYTAATTAVWAVYFGWEFFVAPVGSAGGIYNFCIQTLLMVIAGVVSVINFGEARRHIRLSRTLHVVDATHIHEFRALRLPHRPRGDAPIVLQRSFRVDGVRSVRRSDLCGMASFHLVTDEGPLDLPQVCPTRDAAAIERLVRRPGFRPVDSRMVAADAGSRHHGMGLA